MERNYKVNAAAYARKELAAPILDDLVASGEYKEILQRARRSLSKVNLAFPNELMKFSDIWATDKHYYLGQYIAATRGVRTKYIAPKGQRGAAFVDLFAGPGRVRVRETGEIREGSPLIALQHADAPFSKLIFCDNAPDNVAALGARTTSPSARSRVVPGDCNATIELVASEIPEYGLNIALVDPYALHALKFATLERLSRFQRMDLVVHFPTGDIKRNLEQSDMPRFGSRRRWVLHRGSLRSLP